MIKCVCMFNYTYLMASNNEYTSIIRHNTIKVGYDLTAPISVYSLCMYCKLFDKEIFC